jgi:enterobactin synthetase component D
MVFIKPTEPPDIIQMKGVSVAAVEFDLEHYTLKLYNEMDIKFPDSLKNSVAKRQAEFLAGRFVAKRALEQFGIKKYDIEVGNNRQPLWPSHLIGSITHTSNFACCVVSNKDNYLSLGIDTEVLLNDKTARDIAKSIFTEQEGRILKTYDENFAKSCTLAFSAKESLFKALYSRVNKYFDFLDVEIVYLSDSPSYLTFNILKDLSDEIKAGMSFDCFYEFHNDKVHTLTCDVAKS